MEGIFNDTYCNGSNIIDLTAKIGQESTLKVCIQFDSMCIIIINIYSASVRNIWSWCKKFGTSKWVLHACSLYCSWTWSFEVSLVSYIINMFSTLAGLKCFYSCVKLLLEYNIELAGHRDSSKDTPLHIACRHGHFEIVKYLFSQKASAEIW